MGLRTNFLAGNAENMRLNFAFTFGQIIQKNRLSVVLPMSAYMCGDITEKIEFGYFREHSNDP